MPGISKNDLLTIWDELKADDRMASFPQGWKEHFIIFFEDFAETLALEPAESLELFQEAFTIFSQWGDGYPDPSLLSYLLHLKKYRPDCFRQYTANHEIPEGLAEWVINNKTFPLTREINAALTSSPNPMRVREVFIELQEQVDAFVEKHHCRHILPYDGRSTDQIYLMTGHIDLIVDALLATETDPPG
ncbi:MAG: hypothetical protein HQL52_06395 [Magnetococcales bacterium]|nr:hypothetical protein [Magnetococcales bacterium]